VTETFPNPTALRKAQQEVADFTASRSSARTWSPQRQDLSTAPSSSHGWLDRAGKRTAAGSIRRWPGSKPTPQPCFTQRRKDGRTDLEAVESPCELLSTKLAPPLKRTAAIRNPAADQRQLPCRCGHHAQYQEIRSKLI